MIKQFICNRCHFVENYLEDTPDRCPNCDIKNYTIRFKKNDLTFSKDAGGVDALMRENPRWSWAMGIHVKDIPKMKKLHPDREYHPKTGQLLVRSRHHKLKLMKEHGMEEYV